MVFFVIGPMQAIGVSHKISAKRCPSNSSHEVLTVLGLVNVIMSMARRWSVSCSCRVSSLRHDRAIGFDNIDLGAPLT